MRTSLCLQHEPQSIADAAIYFATVHLENSLDHLGQRALPEVLEVRGRLGIDSEELRSICAQLMEVGGWVGGWRGGGARGGGGGGGYRIRWCSGGLKRL